MTIKTADNKIIPIIKKPYYFAYARNVLNFKSFFITCCKPVILITNSFLYVSITVLFLRILRQFKNKKDFNTQSCAHHN